MTTLSAGSQTINAHSVRVCEDYCSVSVLHTLNHLKAPPANLGTAFTSRRQLDPGFRLPSPSLGIQSYSRRTASSYVGIWRCGAVTLLSGLPDHLAASRLSSKTISGSVCGPLCSVRLWAPY